MIVDGTTHSLAQSEPEQRANLKLGQQLNGIH